MVKNSINLVAIYFQKDLKYIFPKKRKRVLKLSKLIFDTTKTKMIARNYVRKTLNANTSFIHHPLHTSVDVFCIKTALEMKSRE